GLRCGCAGPGACACGAATGMTQRSVGMPQQRRRRRGQAMLLLVTTVLLGAVLASFAVGPLRLPPLEVLQAIAVKLGLLDAAQVSARDLAVVWQLRIPRVLLGAMVGAA